MRLLISVCLLALASTGWADIVAHYNNVESPEDAMTITYHNDSRIRVDFAEQGYMLLTSKSNYMVSRDGNRWVAMDMNEMAKAAKGMVDAMGIDMNELVDDDGFRLRDTGRTETVAGIKGKVFIVSSKGEPDEEVVLSDHADLRKLFGGYIKLVERFASEMDVKSSVSSDLLKEFGNYQGLLRDSNGMVLAKLENVSKPASFYELPAGVKVQTMADMVNSPEVQEAMEQLKNMQIPEGLPPEVQEQLRQLQRR